MNKNKWEEICDERQPGSRANRLAMLIYRDFALTKRNCNTLQIYIVNVTMSISIITYLLWRQNIRWCPHLIYIARVCQQFSKLPWMIRDVCSHSLGFGPEDRSSPRLSVSWGGQIVVTSLNNVLLYKRVSILPSQNTPNHAALPFFNRATN